MNTYYKYMPFRCCSSFISCKIQMMNCNPFTKYIQVRIYKYIYFTHRGKYEIISTLGTLIGFLAVSVLDRVAF